MSKKWNMEKYREEITRALKITRNKRLHEFVFALIVKYYEDPEKFLKGLDNLEALGRDDA